MDFAKPFESLRHHAQVWAEKVSDSLDTVEDRTVVRTSPSDADAPDPRLVLAEARYPTTRNDIVALAIANELDTATLDALLRLPAGVSLSAADVRYHLANN
jgi:hypothetical protein